MGNHFSASKSRSKIDFDWNTTNIQGLDIVNHKYEWENLVMAGGGIRAVAFSGTLRTLEVAGVLCKLKRYCGTSAGAIIATALALGYSANEITDMMLNVNFEQFKESNIFNSTTGLIQNYGLHTGNVFYEWLGKLISTRSGDPDLTFIQIKKQFNKKLFITGCNVNTGKTVYFSHRNYPHMPVRLAVRISMSIPIMFAPVLFENCYYVDGGMFDNYPIDCFDHKLPSDRNNIREQRANKKTLGLRLMADGDTADAVMYNSEYKCESFINFVSALFTHTFQEIEKGHMNADYWTRSIQVHTGNVKASQFDLDVEKKCDLVRSGATAAVVFLRDWVKIAQTPHSRSLSNSLRRHSSSYNSDGSTGDVPGVVEYINDIHLMKKHSPIDRIKNKLYRTKVYTKKKLFNRDCLDKERRCHEFVLLASENTRDRVLLTYEAQVNDMVNFCLPDRDDPKSMSMLEVDEIKEEEKENIDVDAS